MKGCAICGVVWLAEPASQCMFFCRECQPLMQQYLLDQRTQLLEERDAAIAREGEQSTWHERVDEPTEEALEHCGKMANEIFSQWGSSPVISFSTDGLVTTLANAYDDGFAAGRKARWWAGKR